MSKNEKTLMVKKIVFFIVWMLAVILPLPAISGVNWMEKWSPTAALVSPAVIAIIFSWMPKRGDNVIRADKQTLCKIKLKNYAIASLIIGLIVTFVFLYLYLQYASMEKHTGDMSGIWIAVYFIYSIDAAVVCSVLIIMALLLKRKKLNLGKDFKKYFGITLAGLLLSLSPIILVVFISSIFH